MEKQSKAKSSVDFSRELYLTCVEVGNMRGVPVEEGEDYFSWFRKFAMVFTMKDIKEHERIFGTKVEGAFGEIVRIVQDRKRQLMAERYVSFSIKKGARRWIKQKRELRLKTS